MLRHSGVLCIPFPKPDASEARNLQLRQLRDWLIEAAAAADVDLAPVKGSYDSNSEVVAQVYNSIRTADLVVGAVHEANPNVFYECGFAVGWGKPVLYVAHEGDPIPFDIAGVERFSYSVMNPEAQKQLTEAIRACLGSADKRGNLTQPLKDAVQHFMAFPMNSSPLFSLSLQHALSEIGEWLVSTTQSSFEVIGAASVLDAGTHILNNLKSHGFVTQYYSGQASWQKLASKGVRDYYFQATRAAVREGRRVTRVYVVDDESQVDDQEFRQTVMEDVHAGVDVRYLHVGELPGEDARDFGFWDDELVAVIEYTDDSGKSHPPRLHRCTYRCDPASIRRAELWREHIERNAKPSPYLPNEIRLLGDSALELAAECEAHCREVQGRKGDCSDYHLPWQKLRLCGIVSTPGWHSGFYTDAVKRWAEGLNAREERDAAAQVLITGLADYGMLYWLVQALPPAVRSSCEIHVLDICRTPLESCHWLRLKLERISPALKVNFVPHHEDLLDSRRPAEGYDLVLSDAFLTRFMDPDTKAAVMGEWLRILRPRGRIVTTARIRSGLGDIEEAHRVAFVSRAVSAAHERGLDPDPIAEAAQAYADYISSYPFPSLEALREFLVQFGEQINYPDPLSTLIAEQEMVPAHYAHLEIERAT